MPGPTFSPDSTAPAPHDDDPLAAETLELDDPAVVATWTRSLNISEDELRSAAEQVGREVGALYDHIQRSRQLRP